MSLLPYKINEDNKDYSIGYRDGFIRGATKVESLMYSKEELNEALIKENESILEMAKLHMDSRAIIVLQDRINLLKTI